MASPSVSRTSTKPQPTQNDFTVENHGSIFLLQPLTPAAQTWVDEFIPEDAQYFGTAVAVEHRYIISIVDGIKNDGLRIV